MFENRLLAIKVKNKAVKVNFWVNVYKVDRGWSGFVLAARVNYFDGRVITPLFLIHNKSTSSEKKYQTS